MLLKVSLCCDVQLFSNNEISAKLRIACGFVLCKFTNSSLSMTKLTKYSIKISECNKFLIILRNLEYSIAILVELKFDKFL